jgi:hypothetical protein
VAIDWGTAAATVLVPGIAFAISEWDKRRARLIAFYSQRAEFVIQGAGANSGPGTVSLHTVILRNRSSSAVTNVRLHHQQLPLYNIRPGHVQHRIEGADIVLPQVLPNEVVEVSYLYVPPITFAQVNAGIRSDQGFPRAFPVILQRRWPRWVRWVTRTLVLIGLGTVGFWAARLAQYLLSLVAPG